MIRAPRSLDRDTDGCTKTRHLRCDCGLRRYCCCNDCTRTKVLGKASNPSSGHHFWAPLQPRSVDQVPDLQGTLTVAHGFSCRALPQSGLRPIAVRYQVPMLRCGPSKKTFAATAKFSDRHIHRLRTKQNFPALHRISALGRISCLLTVMMLKKNFNSCFIVLTFIQEFSVMSQMSIHAALQHCTCSIAVP